MNRTRSGLALALPAIAALVIGSCSKSPSSGDSVDQNLVLGKVAGKTFTVGDLQNKLKYQYGAAGDFKSAEGAQQAQQILKSAIDEMCWVTLGEKKGYEKDPQFKATWELSRKYILADRTIDHEVRSKEVPTDDEVRKYYDEHQTEFTVPLRVQIAHVLTKTREQALVARARIQKGEAVANVAASMSIDEPTKTNGGTIGWVTATGGGGHLGNVPQFNSAALKLQKGDVSEPVQIPAGWSVLYAMDREEQHVLPFDDKVLEAAKKRLQTKKHNELFTGTLNALKKDYDAQLYMDNFEKFARSLLPEDELWIAAQKEKDTDRRIADYQEIVRRFPAGARAPQSQFMIGFLMADERKDYPAARAAFETFIKEYPDQELVPSARWMLDNMDKPDIDRKSVDQIRRQAWIGH